MLEIAAQVGTTLLGLAELMETLPGWFILTTVTLLGMLIGSFLNVVIWRMPRNCQSIVSPRSQCPRCSTPIAWYDNVPVLSWVILNGKCRSCKKPISMRYPSVEILTGGLFLLIFWLNVVNPERAGDLHAWLTAGTQAVFVVILVAASFIDLDLTVLPDSLTLGGTVVIVGLAALNPEHGGVYLAPEVTQQLMPDGQLITTTAADHGMYAMVANQPPVTVFGITDPHLLSFLGAFFGAAIAGGVMALFRTVATGMLIKKALRFGQGQALGLGDVKLLMLFGAMLGWPGALLSIFGGALVGVLITVPTMLANKQRLFPFGPFLAIAAVILMLAYGPLLGFLIETYGPIFGAVE